MLKKLISSLLFIAVLISTSCSNYQTKEQDTNIYSFTDDADNIVSLPYEPNKVIALFGSYGEIWLESGGQLVGVTSDFYSNYPDNTSVYENLGSLINPNTEKILELHPDFVILSADIQSHYEIANILKLANIPYAFFKQENYRDYLRTLRTFTDMLNNSEIYNSIETKMNTEMNDILSSIHKTDSPKKVLLVRGSSSNIQALGDEHHVGQMLLNFNCVNITHIYPSILKTLNVETILDENPDIILVVPMGDSKLANETFTNTINANPIWQEVSAIKNDNVFFLPKELFQLKPNSRWGESYEYLYNILK